MIGDDITDPGPAEGGRGLLGCVISGLVAAIAIALLCGAVILTLLWLVPLVGTWLGHGWIA
ncbi:hypothetical protein LX15_005199 [Streptoalloteichus tenebrarius]|uniref:Uncharacterized protein n=1 Tax=Streptoalloteichus tenebrarius (strain ATCC 17920 / DSM 40477 / JCM 4838 / CBS 697.72 / NBRC 16177 / NCIMB 11028 / NRRL B-12390 / A12253. 1 / ISP 5477) TaxID=1933 RepID=A0ABT1I164_STRSD|nr:hypothetical protein [Streptoalloteichus tenebrarius]MCP2261473.1 hypothetical protein [Streptoalloteichus tenebrarius]BFE99709.1 hypothetical protein GCM10020241_13850 [Streptoalloteichus tenebrarius]